eukprot:jgi/Orpsp1_1/1191848/evm.model.d7180000088932.1
MLATTENKNKVCIVNEEYVFDKKRTYHLENATKLFFKLNNKIFYNEKLKYSCKDNKFYNDNNVLFEYKLKDVFTHADLTIKNENLNQKIVFSKKFGFNIQFEFYNPTCDEKEVYLFKSHLLGSTYEIYNKKDSTVVCTIKKNNIFGSHYTIEIDEGIDNVFMLMISSVLINLTQRTKTAVASSASN